MSPWIKMSIGGASAFLLLLAGWHARTIWDEAQAAKAQRKQIAEHAEAEKAANAEAADYEQQKQALEKQIYDLKQNVSQARRNPSAPVCRVPPDVVQSVDAAASRGVPR